MDVVLFFSFVSSSPLAANVISKVFVISFTFGVSVGISLTVGFAFSTALLPELQLVFGTSLTLQAVLLHHLCC